jgi:predicted O-linked N-acetylglucosamine transferase (SPINDLY family)
MAGAAGVGPGQAQGLLNGISTLSLANLTDDPMFQLAKAYHYAKHSIGMPKPVRQHVQPGAGGAIRCGFGSAMCRPICAIMR